MGINNNGNHPPDPPDFYLVEHDGDDEICAIAHMVDFMEQSNMQTRRRVFKYLGDRFAAEDWTPIKLET